MEFKSVLEETKSKKKPTKKISKDTRKVKIEKLVDKVSEKEAREITSLDDKKELQKIVNIINRYYGIKTPVTEKREKLVLTSPEKIKIRLKKIGDSQFFVDCIILADKKKDFVKCDWLHVDAIVEERKIMTERGNLDHPVFKIVCLSDLWDRAKTVKNKKGKAKK